MSRLRFHLKRYWDIQTEMWFRCAILRALFITLIDSLYLTTNTPSGLPVVKLVKVCIDQWECVESYNTHSWDCFHFINQTWKLLKLFGNCSVLKYYNRLKQDLPLGDLPRNDPLPTLEGRHFDFIEKLEQNDELILMPMFAICNKVKIKQIIMYMRNCESAF